jgi:hypothetical protein
MDGIRKKSQGQTFSFIGIIAPKNSVCKITLKTSCPNYQVDLFITYFLIKVYKSFNAQKKFGNHSLTPSNGLGIAAMRLNTNRCALSSRKVFQLRPYSLING